MTIFKGYNHFNHMKKEYLMPETAAIEISTGANFLVPLSNPGNSGQDMENPIDVNPFA